MAINNRLSSIVSQHNCNISFGFDTQNVCNKLGDNLLLLLFSFLSSDILLLLLLLLLISVIGNSYTCITPASVEYANLCPFH